MRHVVAVVADGPGEQVLVVLARYGTAIVRGRAAEPRQQRVTRVVKADPVASCICAASSPVVVRLFFGASTINQCCKAGN